MMFVARARRSCLSPAMKDCALLSRLTLVLVTCARRGVVGSGPARSRLKLALKKFVLGLVFVACVRCLRLSLVACAWTLDVCRLRLNACRCRLSAKACACRLSLALDACASHRC